MGDFMDDVENKDEKIKRLEEEVARLRGQIVVTEEEFRGHPVIRFTGSFRPFTLGLSKCRTILKSLDTIRSFVEKYESPVS
jgi:hypothetical protein